MCCLAGAVASSSNEIEYSSNKRSEVEYVMGYGFVKVMLVGCGFD